ncbi:hypothetical protein [Herbaspirillum sp. NPDC087042]|uniref:hypothetical protein n=1 Tax=Herbaspirillum sp. NPDC087042 TaxID=3364004 RepID=UPI0037F9409F
MDIEQVRELIRLAEQGRLGALELRRPDGRLRLEGALPVAVAAMEFTPLATPAPAPAPAPGPVQATAAGFGYFSSRHPVRSNALAADGEQVAAGQVLGLIRVDELYLPVLSPAAGAATCLVADDTLVGYGTPLFDIRAVSA